MEVWKWVMRLKVILIDDEKLALDYFEYQLKSVSDFEIIGKYSDPFQGKRAIEAYDVDLVFLDIEIPDLNGIELAEQILETKPNLPIVFVTAYDEYAIKAFELNAMDYVLKPVSTSRLLMTINRIKKEFSQHNTEFVEQEIGELQLSLFNQVTLTHTINGKKSTVRLKWRTTKIEQLFLYLVQNRGKEVSKSLLVDLIWPDLEQKRAYQQLYTAIYNIRKTVSEYRHHFNIKSIRDGYVLILEDLTIDIVQFETFINSTIPLSVQTVGSYDMILNLYTGDYLDQYDYVWAESERHHLQVKWIQTALKVVNWYVEQKWYDKALILAGEICNRFPLEEEAHFFIMKINEAIGNERAVHHQFEKLINILQSELQIEPSEEIVNWYNRWEKRCAKSDVER